MKNRVIFCLLLALCFTSAYGQIQLSEPDVTKVLYKPLTEESREWLTVVQNGTFYNIKIHCFDGIPYKGQVHLNVDQAPIDEVNYWDSGHIVQNSINFATTKKWIALDGVSIEDTIISIRDIKQISLYIVDAFVGDTVLVYQYPEPIVDTITATRYKWSAEDKELYQQITGEDASSNVVTRKISKQVLSTTYSLPSGIYFAYFINTDDGKLRWVEKIVKE